MVSGALGTVALSQWAPRAPKRFKGTTARVVWYIRDGRLDADMRTLAAEIRYIMAGDSEVLVASFPTNWPMVGDVFPVSSKSLGLPVS